MSNRTSLRLRVLPRFPARIVGTNGLDAERDGTDMVVKPDFGALVQIPSVSKPETTYFWGWDQSIDMYSRISFQDLVSNIQSVIIGPTTAAMEATTPGSDQFIYFTGPDAAAVTGITEAGRSLINDADAEAQRATLELGDSATKDVGTGSGTVAAGDDSRIINAIQSADYLWPIAKLGSPTGSDWTTVINNALAAGAQILLPEGETGVTGLIVTDRSVIKGVHRKKSVLKLLDGSNKHVISTENFDSKFGTADTAIAPQGIVLLNFTINGNRANNTAGCGIALYARLFSIGNMDLFNIPDDGIKCDYRDSASGSIAPGASGMLGMEAEFRWIGMDFIGGHGMWMRGPHDSYLEHVHVIHASQKTTNTYDSFRFEATFTSRGNNLHCYNSGTVANQRYGIYDAAGCDIINSHFEGSASANIYIKAQRALYDNIRAYATRNAPYNVIIGGNQSLFRGHLGGKASGVDCIGIRLGLDGTDWSGENIIDAEIIDNNAGSIDFSLSQGQNKITVRGAQSSGSVIVSNPALSDTLDVLVSGVRYTNSRNSLTATGTTAADALQLTAPINRVTTVAANTGVKLPPAASLTGTRVLVINAGANPLKVYHSGSDAIEYVGFPASVTVPIGKAASFEVAFSNLFEPIISD